MDTVERIFRTINGNNSCIDSLLDVKGAVGSKYIMDSLEKLQAANNSLTILHAILSKRQNDHDQAQS